MKKTIIISIIIILTIFSMYVLINNTKNKEIIIIGTETPPFEYYNENNELVGIHIEFLEKIFTKLNLKYKIKILNWDEALNQIKNGKADIILGAGYTPEREEFISYQNDHKTFHQRKIIPEDTLWITKEVFFYKNNKKYNLESYTDIKQNEYRIGIVNEYAYFDELWEAKLNFYSFKNTEELILRLNKEEIDLAAIDILEGISQIKKMGLNISDFNISRSLKQDANFILFHKKYDKPRYNSIKEEFYSELIRLKKEENLHEKLFQKYLGISFTEFYS